jgi:hypothetical protein
MASRRNRISGTRRSVTVAKRETHLPRRTGISTSPPGRGPRTKILALSERHESESPSPARRVRYFCARPARGSGVGNPGRRIGSRKGTGNSASRETFRTGRRKARAESRFRWRTKRQPVRGTLSTFEPPPRAAVPVDAPPPVNVQVGISPQDPADETAVGSI